MLNKFGGFERFCELWWQSIQDGMERQPGSRVVLNHIMAIMKIQEVEEQRIEERYGRDVQLMTNEELDERLNSLIRKAAIELIEEFLESGQKTTTGSVAVD